MINSFEFNIVYNKANSPCTTLADRKFRPITASKAYITISGSCAWKIKVPPGQTIVLTAITINGWFLKL